MSISSTSCCFIDGISFTFIKCVGSWPDSRVGEIYMEPVTVVYWWTCSPPLPSLTLDLAVTFWLFIVDCVQFVYTTNAEIVSKMHLKHIQYTWIPSQSLRKLSVSVMNGYLFDSFLIIWQQFKVISIFSSNSLFCTYQYLTFPFITPIFKCDIMTRWWSEFILREYLFDLIKDIWHKTHNIRCNGSLTQPPHRLNSTQADDSKVDTTILGSLTVLILKYIPGHGFVT